MNTIVVGMDGSGCSVAALRWALEEARLRGARIRAVYAWGTPFVSTYHEAAHYIDTDFAAVRAAATRVLEAAVADAVGGRAGVEVEQIVVEGPAAGALIDASRDAALLVVGSRGIGGFTGLLLGSVSHQCAQHAACPVVIVREERAA